MKQFAATGAMILSFAASYTDVVASELNIQLVYELNRVETNEGHVAHAGQLWTSEGRSKEGDTWKVHVFSLENGEKVATLAIPHSAQYLHPYSQDSVLAIGRSPDPWRTHYSILLKEKGAFRIKTTFNFPTERQMYRFGGDSQKMFFNEPGDRSVYSFTTGRSTKIGSDISMPAMMKWDADSSLLWIVESGALGFGDENIAYIDMKSGETKRVFEKKRDGITDIELFADLGWVVANETMTDSVLFITTRNRKVAATEHVPGGPRGMARIGKCVAITSETSKSVTFFALDGDKPEQIASWDVSSAGDRLKSPRSIAVDPESARVYLRSAYPCGGCSVTQSSIFSVVDDGAVAARCL